VTPCAPCFHPLRPRTRVLRYLARGMQKKEIAQVMCISVNTVNRHTTSLMNKLDIHDRVELADSPYGKVWRKREAGSGFGVGAARHGGFRCAQLAAATRVNT